jgi:hypothetical protein
MRILMALDGQVTAPCRLTTKSRVTGVRADQNEKGHKLSDLVADSWPERLAFGEIVSCVTCPTRSGGSEQDMSVWRVYALVSRHMPPLLIGGQSTYSVHYTLICGFVKYACSLK